MRLAAGWLFQAFFKLALFVVAWCHFVDDFGRLSPVSHALLTVASVRVDRLPLRSSTPSL